MVSAPHEHPGIPATRPAVVRVFGISGLRRARLFDMVQAGDQRLPGEIIRLAGGEALAQIYEPPSGRRAGDPAIGAGGPPSIELGPGLLGSIVDGTGRPLTAIAQRGERVTAGHSWPAGPACRPLTAAGITYSGPR
jgi:V/A-type H+/Na+-transporting ATPase subunit A